MHPEPYLEIHPKTAREFKLQNDDLVKVTSTRGEAVFKVQITKAINAGTVFAPMHWGFLWANNAEANNLTHAIACPISKQPELKACAVNLTKVTNSPINSVGEQKKQMMVFS